MVDDSEDALYGPEGVPERNSLRLPQEQCVDSELGRISQRSRDEVEKNASLAGGSADESYPLSPLQEGMLFHYLLNNESDFYVLSTLIELQDRSNVNALVKAVQTVVDRHPVLRAAFAWENIDRPVQVVHKRATVRVRELAPNATLARTEQLAELMKPDYERMDVRQAPLLRVLVVSPEHDGPFHAVVRVHHLVCDHQSLRLLIDEVLACIAGRENELPLVLGSGGHPLPDSNDNDEEKAAIYFRERLGDLDETTAPFGILDTHGDVISIEERSMVLGRSFSNEVRAAAAKFGVTPARVFHAAWSLVVARATGRSDIVFGTVLQATQRKSRRGERSLGMTVNTLPLRVALSDLTAAQLLDRVHRDLTELRKHCNTPLAQAQRYSGVAPTLPLFTTLLNFRRSDPRDLICGGEIAGVRVIARQEALSTYPIALTVDDSGEDFTLLMKANQSIGASRLLEYVRTALDSLTSALQNLADSPAMRLEVLPRHERVKLIEEFNCTEASYPSDSMIHQFFEEQVRRNPHRVAVSYAERELSFSELNTRANQLAHYLVDRGVGPERMVAICLERGIDLVVGVLAILKAGGAYLPLDPTYPAEQLGMVLEDAFPHLVLATTKMREKLSSGCWATVYLDEAADAIAGLSGLNIEPADIGLFSGNLAYVIYTSGSTGRPKGVMVEHRNVMSLWKSIEHLYPDGENLRVAINASFSFDASVKQLVQLLSGRTIVLVPSEHRWDAKAIIKFVNESEVGCIDCTPWQLKSWLDAGMLRSSSAYPSMILVGGEALDHSLWAELVEHAGVAVNNVYGPTENTVDTTYVRVESGARSSEVGKPMENRQVYIVGSGGDLSPIGVAGEITAGGAGVARGYLNRPGITAQRFIADPFSGKPSNRIYRTGDVGRWLASGSIEYLGRNDHQIKIRGFRVEPGEIEAVLAQHEHVKDAVVIVRHDVPGTKVLVAYLTYRDVASRASANELRAHLRSRLPEHMVPSAFVALPSFPISRNGKLDRAALPRPSLEAYAVRSYEPPQNEVEKVLCALWESLLSVSQVGRHDNFFELGGHSILAATMVERLRSSGLIFEVRHIFQAPILSDLAAKAGRSGVHEIEIPKNLITSDCQVITPGMLSLTDLEQQHIDSIVSSVPGGALNVQDIYPLAPLQEGILFHHLMTEQKTCDAYVASTLLAVPTKEAAQQLIGALQFAVDRHDALRTAILWQDLPEPVQVVYRQARLPVTWVTESWEGKFGADWLNSRNHQMDLRRAPLMRLEIAPHDRDGACHVLLQLHHIIADATSLRTVIAEVVNRLSGECKSSPQPIPYRNYVARTRAYARSDAAEAFFRENLGGVSEPTAPFGIVNVHGDGSDIDETRLELEGETARRIRACAQSNAVGAATLFHAAFALVVAATSKREDVVVGTVLLGRMHNQSGENRGVGLFINTLPLRVKVSDIGSRELVHQIQQGLARLLDHEYAPLSLAQACSGVDGIAPLFTALMNYRSSSPTAGASWNDAGIKVDASRNLTNYPITVSIDDAEERFAITAQVHKHVGASRFAAYVESALLGLVVSLERGGEERALAVPVLPTSERRMVVDSFNETFTKYEMSCGLVHMAFAQQAQRTPSTIALIYRDSHLTYDELSLRAVTIAAHLEDSGVLPGQLVGLCIDRGPDMVAGLLGILSVGAAYLPLDPNYPPARLGYMIEDASPTVVICQASTRQLVPSSIRSLTIDAEFYANAKIESEAPTVDGFVSSGLAYVIYTSGSTGRPKATAMTHSSLMNLIQWQRESLPLRLGERVLQFAALSFDVAFQEISTTLCNGGTLVLVEESDRKDPRALVALCREQAVERLFVPPLMLQAIAEYSVATGDDPGVLRDVVTAGEQLRVTPEITLFFDRVPGRTLHNHYGPTETHVVTSLTLSGRPHDWPSIPSIGRPIANCGIYILDQLRQPVPLGVPGEIYLGGANVGDGYRGKPQLTAERFVANPFGRNSYSRMYRTGDLGKWLEDGSVEYLGRNDDQVKIRGFRIELSEIESQLMRHGDVKQAAVMAHEYPGRGKVLVAYIAGNIDKPGLSDELSAALRMTLPDFMIPAAYVQLPHLPLTPSGKLNRRALPPPVFDGEQTARSAQSLMGYREEALGRIWQKLLGVGTVGRNESFFSLGAHSILAIKLVLMVNKTFGVALRVIDIYNAPTIADLSERISGAAGRDFDVNLEAESHLDCSIAPGALSQSRSGVAFLTGGTGFVGRFLAVKILRASNEKLCWLVRSASEREGFARIKDTLVKWKLWDDSYSKRIIVIPGDLQHPRLGISDCNWEYLRDQVDTIYHCGTSMNHLETYEMARVVNVGSAREILTLAMARRVKVVNCISTLGVFRPGADMTRRAVHEDSPIDNEVHRNSQGYVASKWVAEKIFMRANERGLPCNIFRVGLVWADAELGRYDELQRVYRLIKTCLMTGFGIANHHFDMAPTPVDYVAQATVLLAEKYRSGGGIFHICASEKMRQGFFESVDPVVGGFHTMLPYYEWICEIKRLHDEGVLMPATPLLQSLFAMDRDELREYLRRTSYSSIEFGSDRTSRELEYEGLVMPPLDARMATLCVKDMIERDHGLSTLRWAQAASSV